MGFINKRGGNIYIYIYIDQCGIHHFEMIVTFKEKFSIHLTHFFRENLNPIFIKNWS